MEINYPDVIILFDGYSNDYDNGKMDANCTCTLIKGRENVIVDTMTAWDREKIINALAMHKLCPDDINYVICTHSHSDHIGNNNLFTNAIAHIVGNCRQNSTIFHELIPNNDGYVSLLDDTIEIKLTPGHTYDDITVYVNSKFNGELVCVAITGDLFEKESDIYNPLIWKKLGRPELEIIQANNRLNVINRANYIVPGHGPIFKVTEEMKKILLEQTVKYSKI